MSGDPSADLARSASVALSVASGSGTFPSKNVGGRPPNPVWQYFKDLGKSGAKKKVECKFCSYKSTDARVADLEKHISGSSAAPTWQWAVAEVAPETGLGSHDGPLLDSAGIDDLLAQHQPAPAGTHQCY